MVRGAQAMLLCLALVLAGCAGDSSDEETGPATLDVETSKDLGAISGVVVDQGIAPIAGASVRLEGVGNATTGDDGQFVFEELEPSTYFLNVDAVDHDAIQTTVDVVAGEVAKPKVQLPYNPEPQPYHQTRPFEGRMVLSDYYVIWELTYRLGNTSLCYCIFDFMVDPGFDTVVLDAVWTNSINIPGDRLYWEIWGGEDLEGYEAEFVESPANLRYAGAGFGAGQDNLWIQVSSDETPDFEQPFEGFLTLFYNGEAPEEWAAV